jgi:hypothetical protein
VAEAQGNTGRRKPRDAAPSASPAVPWMYDPARQEGYRCSQLFPVLMAGGHAQDLWAIIQHVWVMCDLIHTSSLLGRCTAV